MVIGLDRLSPAFVPRLGRHRFSLSIVAVHGWLGGCRHFLALCKNVLVSELEACAV